jgi:hypothetical protein
MTHFRDLNQDNTNATLAHLNYLINRGGTDAVATAVDRLITDLSDRREVEI